MHKIALVQLGKSGDILQTNKLINNLNMKYPHSEVTLICNNFFLDTANITDANKVLPINIEDITEIEAGDSESVIKKKTKIEEFKVFINSFDFNMVVNPNIVHLAEKITNLINCNTKFGYGSKDEKSKKWLLYPLSFIESRKLNTINLVDIYANMFYIPNHPENKFHEQTIFDFKKKRVFFQLASRNVKRQWPLIYFARLGKLLISSGNKIILGGSSDEVAYGERFQNELIKTGLDIETVKSSIENYIGRTSFPELGNLLKSADCLVTTDTGTMHFAAFHNIPFLAIFTGSAYPYETLGYSLKSKAMIPDVNKFFCYPCEDDACCPYNLECQKSIGVESVFSILNNENPSCDNVFSVTLDELGQNLKPLSISGNLKHLFFATIYRKFALKIFFDFELKKKITINSLDYNKIYNEFLREEQILKFFYKNPSKNDFVKNLEILKPLYYFRKFYGDRFIFKVVNYIKTELENFI